MRKLGLLAIVLAMAGCNVGNSGSSPISGDITVLTDRTDIVETVFQDYERKFQAKYPQVHVTFEAITDYDGELKNRIKGKDYGDVLLIPSGLRSDQLAGLFEPLGTVDQLKTKYRFASEVSYQGTVYGLATFGNAMGLVYNKRIWKEAGVTEPPKTPDEFLADLAAIKAKTRAIPLFTNYKDGWLSQWEANRGAVSADPEALIKLAQDDAPWAAGKEHNIIDSLLFDAVKNGLTEPDPNATNFDASKRLLGDGTIATIMLRSWSIGQMQSVAAKPAEIGYLPFPTQVGGKFHSVISGDYKNGINVNSKHKAAARAWLDWFVGESHYAVDQGSVPVLRSEALPTALAEFTKYGVEYIEMVPEPKGLIGRISDASDLLGTTYRQRIVDAARGVRPETKEAIFADLNQRWAAAKAKAS
jgi:raffinose/stachyose/melibiose transport system substrate-binding protein